MNADLIQCDRSGSVVEIALNRPAQRNALCEPMMEALLVAIRSLGSRHDDASVVLLRGSGPAFCAGFDLAEAVAQPGLMARYIEQLGAITRGIRRLPQVVVAAVQGAALAGGCAIVSACDFVVAGADASFGYPVHRIGVSPAVTIPTLRQKVGDGAARALLMGGQIIDAREAHCIGLVSQVVESSESLDAAASELCRSLSQAGPAALRATKRWINELDGSFDDAPFDAAAGASADLAAEPEAEEMLRAFWSQRRRGG